MEELELTQAEKQELEALRAEKAAAALQAYAAEHLKKHGIDGDFAAFLTGATQEETAQKVQSFAKKLDAVTQKLRTPPPPAPEFGTEPKPRQRGIRIL